MCWRPETEDERNASNRQRLSAALDRCESLPKVWCGDAKTIMAAAHKHLATLPKPTKTIWRISWTSKDDNGTSSEPYDSADAACSGVRLLLHAHPGCVISITPHQVPV